MGVKIIKQLAIAWNIMWAFSYLVVAFLAPSIGGKPVWLSIMVFLVFGSALLISTILTGFYTGMTKKIGRITLAILAVISVYRGIASWTGIQLWDVPFANRELFQVSMAFADLIGAVFMLNLALENA